MLEGTGLSTRQAREWGLTCCCEFQHQQDVSSLGEAFAAISPSTPGNVSCNGFGITSIQTAHPESGASSTPCPNLWTFLFQIPFIQTTPDRAIGGDFLSCRVKAIENKWRFWSSPLKQLAGPQTQTRPQPHSVINSRLHRLRGGRCNPLSRHAPMKTHALHHPKLPSA